MSVDLGRMLRNGRLNAGLKARAVARKLGIAHTTLWTWERGENPRSGRPAKPDRDRLLILANMYGLDYKRLLSAAGYEEATMIGVLPLSRVTEVGAGAEQDSITPIEIGETDTYRALSILLSSGIDAARKKRLDGWLGALILFVIDEFERGPESHIAKDVDH